MEERNEERTQRKWVENREKNGEKTEKIKRDEKLNSIFH